MLERDAATKRLITRIRALAPGAAKAAASAPVACGGRRTRSSRAAVSGDPGVLDGVYRYELTDVLLRASGVTDAGGLAENHGVYTWTLSDGEWCWEARAPNPQQNPDDCGTYTVAGNELTFDLPDLGPVTYRWETTGDGDLRLAIVRVPTDFEPFARATVARPWRRVADAPAAAGFPEGAYRSELKEEFLRDRGISKSDAVAAEGIQTLTFRDGRWSHATDDNVTTPPTCEGPYSVEGSRVVLRFDATVDRCGVAGFKLFSARWQLKGRVLRLLDVRAGDQDADSFARVVWGGRPWQRVG